MNRIRARFHPIFWGPAFLLCIAGCPSSVESGTLAASGAIAADTAEAAMKVLGAQVDASDLVALQTDVPATADPYFGEDPALYEGLGVEAIGRLDPSDAFALIGAPPAGPNGPRDPVAEGGLIGRFFANRPGGTSDTVGGIVRGRWFNARHERIGHFRGEYRPLPPDRLPEGLAGGGVFRAVYRDLAGNFRGLIHGRYGHVAGEQGLFFGRWLDRDERLIGVVRGHWVDRPELDGGDLVGRWAALDVMCDDGGEDPAALIEEELAAVGLDESAIAGLTLSELPLAGETIDPDTLPIDQEPQMPLLLEGPCIDPATPRGALRGHWGPDRPDDPTERPGDGWFRAVWRNRAGEEVAVMFGRYAQRRPEPPAPVESLVAPGRAAAASRLLAPRGTQPAEAAGAAGGTQAEGAAVTPPPPARGAFIGIVLGMDGERRGTVRGLFRAGHEPGLGMFRGHVLGNDGFLRAVLRGRWDKALSHPGGPILGVWLAVNPGGDGGDGSSSEGSPDEVTPVDAILPLGEAAAAR